MGKSEKLVFTIVTALLILVLLVFVLRLQSANEAARVYRVSVITDATNMEYNVNCKKGLDRAARDYNVDLKMIVLHEGMTVAQQKDSLQKELDTGADAIILNIHGETEILTWLESGPFAIPLIAMDMGGASGAFAYRVYHDDYLMGAMLAREMLRDGVDRCEIRYARESSQTRLRYQGVQSVLSQSDVPCHTESDFTSAQWLTMERGVFVAALDEDSVTKLTGSSLTGNIRLYGIGCTNDILNELEAGSVNKLVAEDEYAMGYLALRGAVQSIHGKTGMDSDVLSCYAVDGTALFKEPLEHVLFPIG